MVITVPVQAQLSAGPRPINLNRDIPQVLSLLELVFGRALGADGHQLITGNFEMGSQPAILWRLSPGASRLAMGYVWEENGRIVGNATVLSTKTIGRYLIVNVAVHPDFRRRGIARGLMDTVIRLVRERGGHDIILQVEKDNAAAVKLYNALGFETVGSMTTWRTAVLSIQDLPYTSKSGRKPLVRELRRNEWQAAYELDLRSLHPDLNWPDTLPPDNYRGGFWTWLERLLTGRRSESWVISSRSNRLLGVASIWSEWGRPHRLGIRVLPEWRGKLERPLFTKLIRRLHHFPRRNVRIEHPADDEFMNELLREASFRPRRTLTHMRLHL